MILHTLLQIEPELNPTDFMTDFEMAAINAIHNIFPMAETHCCLFHFAQNVWRHIQSVGLQTIYNEDEEFAFNLRLLIALAFVPIDDVEKAYAELIETPFFTAEGPHRNAIDKLMDYFQPTYIYGYDRFGKRKPPLFDIKLWNVYEETLSGEYIFLKIRNQIY